MTIITAVNFCDHCGSIDIEPLEEICVVCREAIEAEDLLILSKLFRHNGNNGHSTWRITNQERTV